MTDAWFPLEPVRRPKPPAGHPAKPTPAELLLNAQQEFIALVDSLIGFVAQLTDAGFTPEQARQIVTITYTTSMHQLNQKGQL